MVEIDTPNRLSFFEKQLFEFYGLFSLLICMGWPYNYAAAIQPGMLNLLTRSTRATASVTARM